MNMMQLVIGLKKREEIAMEALIIEKKKSTIVKGM